MAYSGVSLDTETLERLKQAVQSNASVNGLTHNFYRYPARFSPKFVREAIDIFSKPGDVILDPFVGGGTTLVEAFAANRHSIGFDVSPIATFVSKTKTTLLLESNLTNISNWSGYALNKTILGHKATMTYYDEEGYLNNLPWRIKRIVEIILVEIQLLKAEVERNFAKCILLKTAQWAIDCKENTPTIKEFKKGFSKNLIVLSNGMRELSKAVLKTSKKEIIPNCLVITDSCETIVNCKELKDFPDKPKLVITSPPYVGVHMLYHQWQVNSRRRTRVPFWIIDKLDGQGSSFYTFGDYRNHAKKSYFEIAKKAFTAVHSSLHDEGLIVQLVGFSDHNKFLPRYLEMMDEAGYEELFISKDTMNRIKRVWRNVPNRKWYNNTKKDVSISKEVLLVHRKK